MTAASASLTVRAEQGDPSAQFELAGRYEFGDGVVIDTTQAIRWYQRAAEQGYVDAQLNLAWLYRTGGEAMDPDPRKAIYWYEQAAQQNNMVAQYLLGSLYERGEGVEKNLGKARHWLLQAALQGHSDAQFHLAELADTDDETYRDPVWATFWYTQAKKQGVLIAAEKIAHIATQQPAFYLARNARVRNAPSVTAPFLVELPTGSRVAPLGKRGNWFAVILDNNETLGWIHESSAFGRAY